MYYYESEFGKTLTIKDISCFYEIKSSTAIQFVNSLEKHGYIVRMNDSKDKRVTLVTLTNYGKEVGEIISKRNHEMVQKILATQEKEELEQKQHKAQDRTTTLINSFMEDGGFNLQTDDEDELEKNYPTSYKAEDLEEEAPEAQAIDHSNTEAETEEDKDYFTETLARIYIKQGRYEKALEIIKRLNLNNPKKNAYFADQIRFLEKLIINNKNK